MQALLILPVTLIVFILVTSLPGLRDWKAAITTRKQAAFFIILPLIIIFLGSTEAAQLNTLLSDIPRIARAFLTSILFALSLFSLSQHTESWKLSGTGARWMVYFSLLAIISASWSLSALISAWKGFEMLTITLSVLSIAHTLKKEEDIRWLLNLISACLLFLVISVIVGLIFFPSEAIKIADTTYTKKYFAIRGLVPIMNPATIGTVAALLLISTFSSNLVSKTHSINKNNIGLWVVSGLAIADMLMGHSRTPIFACVIAIVGILYFAKKTKQMIAAAILGGVVMLATSAIDFVLSYIYRGQSEESFTSLTGRFDFWERHVFSLIADAPILGHGYYAGFRETFNVGSLDNSFLAVLSGLGFLGFIIFLIPIIYGTINIIRTRSIKKHITERDACWLIIFGFFSVILIRSFTGTAFEVMHPLLIVYMALMLSIASLVRLNKTNTVDDTAPNENIKNDTFTNNRVIIKKTSTVLNTLTSKKK